jgi:hypothetical protein
MNSMGRLQSNDPREIFEYFSNEYSQALQGLQTIEVHAGTTGYSDELRELIDQFLDNTTNARNLAREKNEPNFAEWFQELIDKAEELAGKAAP